MALCVVRMPTGKLLIASYSPNRTDALVALRARIRRVQNENQQLLDRMETQRQENGTNVAARRFLDAIDLVRRPDGR